MTKKLLLTAVISVFMLITGCASTPNYYPNELYLNPELNKKHTVSMGEKMLETAVVYYSDCLRIKEDLSVLVGFIRQTAKSNETYCKAYINTDIYDSSEEYKTQYGNMMPTTRLQVKELGNNKLRVCILGGNCKSLEGNEFKLTKDRIIAPTHFQQTIEYMGGNNTQLHFTYSETQGGQARPAFTRDFQVDLNSGNTLAYKGARIEIIKATNSDITYKVLSSFSN